MRQKGFTFIELLLVMAVSGVLLVGAVLSIQQVAFGTSRSNSQVVALTDLDHAALLIKKDLMMTQFTPDLTDGDPVPQSSVTLTWIDYSSFVSDNQSYHSSSYNLTGTELWRNYDGTVRIAGRHITSVGFTRNGRVINVVITAAGPGAIEQSETVEFSGYMRAEEVE